jgi:hypothetical protein
MFIFAFARTMDIKSHGGIIMNSILKAFRNAFSSKRYELPEAPQFKENKLYEATRKGGDNPLHMVSNTPAVRARDQQSEFAVSWPIGRPAKTVTEPVLKFQPRSLVTAAQVKAVHQASPNDMFISDPFGCTKNATPINMIAA